MAHLIPAFFTKVAICMLVFAIVSGCVTEAPAAGDEVLVRKFFELREQMLDQRGTPAQVEQILSLFKDGGQYEHPAFPVILTLDEAKSGLRFASNEHLATSERFCWSGVSRSSRLLARWTVCCEQGLEFFIDLVPQGELTPQEYDLFKIGWSHLGNPGVVVGSEARFLLQDMNLAFHLRHLVV